MLTDAGITMMKTFEIVKPEKYMNLDQICNVIESMVPHESLPDRVLRMSLRCSWSAEVMVAPAPRPEKWDEPLLTWAARCSRTRCGEGSVQTFLAERIDRIGTEKSYDFDRPLCPLLPSSPLPGSAAHRGSHGRGTCAGSSTASRQAGL